jgi:hypothetical protein
LRELAPLVEVGADLFSRISVNNGKRTEEKGNRTHRLPLDESRRVLRPLPLLPVLPLPNGHLNLLDLPLRMDLLLLVLLSLILGLVLRNLKVLPRNLILLKLNTNRPRNGTLLTLVPRTRPQAQQRLRLLDRLLSVLSFIESGRVGTRRRRGGRSTTLDPESVVGEVVILVAVLVETERVEALNFLGRGRRTHSRFVSVSGRAHTGTETRKKGGEEERKRGLTQADSPSH